MIPKIAPWKPDRVSELKEIVSKEGIVGVVDISGVPAKNMLDMRNSLRGMMTMTMAKKSLIRLAWKEAGLSEDNLEELLEGAIQPCVVHTDSLNCYELFDELEKTRQGRAAKEGEIAPDDIIVEAGPTDFGPGPIVGEFNAVGIPAKIDKGAVAIQKTVTVVNKGEPIEGDLGLMLSKLGINPIIILKKLKLIFSILFSINSRIKMIGKKKINGSQIKIPRTVNKIKEINLKLLCLGINR